MTSTWRGASNPSTVKPSQHSGLPQTWRVGTSLQRSNDHLGLCPMAFLDHWQRDSPFRPMLDHWQRESSPICPMIRHVRPFRATQPQTTKDDRQRWYMTGRLITEFLACPKCEFARTEAQWSRRNQLDCTSGTVGMACTTQWTSQDFVALPESRDT